MIGSARIKNNFAITMPTACQWCPECGNRSLLHIIKDVLQEKDFFPRDVTFVSGSDFAGKLPQCISCNYFCGLRGHILSLATGVKIAQPLQTVIAVGGSDAMCHSGGNDFVQAIHRDIDMTVLVHNTMVYDVFEKHLSQKKNYSTSLTAQKCHESFATINPLALAISQDASFVARVYVDDVQRTHDIITRAIEHKGFSLVDVIQPCSTYHADAMRGWMHEYAHYVEEDDDITNCVNAYRRVTDAETMYLGVVYTRNNKNLSVDNSHPLYQKEPRMALRRALISSQE